MNNLQLKALEQGLNEIVKKYIETDFKEKLVFTTYDLNDTLATIVGDFFVIQLIPTTLNGENHAKAVLLDYHTEINGNTFIFAIFIDVAKIAIDTTEYSLSLLLSKSLNWVRVALVLHEFLHFICYFDLYLTCGGNGSTQCFDTFKWTVSKGFNPDNMGNDAETIADVTKATHNSKISSVDEIGEMIGAMAEYEHSHYDKFKGTIENYQALYADLYIQIHTKFFKQLFLTGGM